MAASLNNSAWLQWMTNLMGGASRQACAATLPPDQFYCLLDDLPLHLIPQHARKRQGPEQDEFLSQALFLNPDCLICAEGNLPVDLSLQQDLLQKFALQGTIAWVRDRATSSLLPFWLGPEFEAVVRGLSPNEPVQSSVPERARRVLAAAGILVPKGEVSDAELTRRRSHDAIFAKAASSFREKGHAPLSGLIHPFHVAALRSYYRYLIRTGAIALGDAQSPLRYVAYNEPVARFFHHILTPTFSAVAGEPLQPSYTYMASYLSGADLDKHTDRPQCEFSITLCLDFSPEPVLATPWPIRLSTPGGEVSVYQALGDGLAYRGTQLPHYRDALGAGQTSTSIFFHYVGKDFAGSLN